MNPIKVNKRHVILASIILALSAAVGINYWLSPLKFSKNGIMTLTQTQNNSNTSSYTNNDGVKNSKEIEKLKTFFDNERRKKEEYRTQLSKIASNDQECMKKILERVDLENKIETMIRSKFDENLIDCIARIVDNGCNVVASFKTQMTKEHVRKIERVIKDLSDFKNNQIIISEKKCDNS